jgi:hypothetical protein
MEPKLTVMMPGRFKGLARKLRWSESLKGV